MENFYEGNLSHNLSYTSIHYENYLIIMIYIFILVTSLMFYSVNIT